MISRRNWTVRHCATAMALALDEARGSAQAALIRGEQNLSGSALRGTQRNWRSRYARTRAELLRRLDAAGIPRGERVGPHGARLLIIGIGCERPQ